MANVKISDLTPASGVADANEFEINEAGSSKKVTGTQISSYVRGDIVTADISDVSVTSTELGYVEGVTSAIQTQLNAKIEETAATGSAVLPAGTDAQRDGSPAAGYIRFNTTNDSFEGYDGTEWNAIGGADFASVAEDILPDADNTRDLGASGNEWAEGHFENIYAQNISDGTTTVGTEYVVNGSAKSWASFNGSGTIAFINTYNAASLTDVGVGQYTVGYTNSFAQADNAVSISSNGSSDAFGVNRTFDLARSNEAAEINMQFMGDGGAAADPTRVYSALWGDLA